MSFDSWKRRSRIGIAESLSAMLCPAPSPRNARRATRCSPSRDGSLSISNRLCKNNFCRCRSHAGDIARRPVTAPQNYFHKLVDWKVSRRRVSVGLPAFDRGNPTKARVDYLRSRIPQCRRMQFGTVRWICFQDGLVRRSPNSRLLIGEQLTHHRQNFWLQPWSRREQIDQEVTPLFRRGFIPLHNQRVGRRLIDPPWRRKAVRDSGLQISACPLAWRVEIVLRRHVENRFGCLFRIAVSAKCG